ncbi:MAG: hypothetical protein KDK34_23885, partial [Leptospiraceae bacterium]|nr:hypothetical protein [Leptospiraceae bacterium]
GVLIAIRNFLSGDRMFAYFFDVLDWHWQLRLELIAIYLAWPLFLTYLSHAFPRMLHRIPLRVVQISAAVFALAALFLPSYIHTRLIIIFEIALILSGVYLAAMFIATWRRRMTGRFIATVGFLILFATIINDIMYERSVFNTGYLLSSGFFIFIFSQSYLLARQFVQSFQDAEKYSRELRDSNRELRVIQEQLEERVTERTQALEDSRRRTERARSELEQLNEFARKINTSIELDEILNQIFEYIEAHFDIEATFVQFYNSKDNTLEYYGCSRSAELNPASLAMLKELVVPMTEDGGFFYYTFRRQKPFYLSRVDRAIRHEFDSRTVNTLGVSSFLFVPLVIHDAVTAIISFTSFRKRMQLSRRDIQSING